MIQLLQQNITFFSIGVVIQKQKRAKLWEKFLFAWGRGIKKRDGTVLLKPWVSLLAWVTAQAVLNSSCLRSSAAAGIIRDEMLRHKVRKRTGSPGFPETPWAVTKATTPCISYRSLKASNFFYFPQPVQIFKDILFSQRLYIYIFNKSLPSYWQPKQESICTIKITCRSRWWICMQCKRWEF